MAATELTRLADWAAGLRMEDVPERVIEQAKNQIFCMLGAVHAGYSSELGGAIEASFPWRGAGPAPVIPTGEQTDPVSAAVLMSAWSMVLDYDDVMLGGHTGHSSVLVPLAFAGFRELRGRDLLLAQIVSNEVAARINMAAALGPARGQMAARLHLAAAAAARAKSENLPADVFAHALALALSYPAKACYASFLGSDAKAFSAAWPVRWGLEAVDAARAGLRGNLAILEDGGGFLAGETPCPLREFLRGLGSRWHTETNSFKTHPGSAYLQAAVEAGIKLAARTGIQASRVLSVRVYGPALLTGMEERSRPYLAGGDSRVATLSFSTAYAVACAIVHGRFGPEHLREPAKRDPLVWRIAANTRICHDPGLTVQTLRAEIPIGAALSCTGRMERIRFLASGGNHSNRSQRIRLSPWDKLRIAAALCRKPAIPLPDDFSDLKKVLPARVVVETDSGTVEESVSIPAGFAGSGHWRTSRALMRIKYVECAAENIGMDRALKSAALLEGIEGLGPEQLTRVLFLISRDATPAPDAALEVWR